MLISSIDTNQMVLLRRCVNDSDNFCYTCGEFTLKASRKLISDFYKNSYRACFQVKLVDQDKKWALHIVCKMCLENMRLSDFVQESVPEAFSQSKLNDLVRDLSLSKESAELLASKLNEKHLLARDT